MVNLSASSPKQLKVHFLLHPPDDYSNILGLKTKGSETKTIYVQGESSCSIKCLSS
jgi:hypothetical protein